MDMLFTLPFYLFSCTEYHGEMGYKGRKERRESWGCILAPAQGWQGGMSVPSGMLCLPAGSSQDLVRLWELYGNTSFHTGSVSQESGMLKWTVSEDSALWGWFLELGVVGEARRVNGRGRREEKIMFFKAHQARHILSFNSHNNPAKEAPLFSFYKWHISLPVTWCEFL